MLRAMRFFFFFFFASTLGPPDFWTLAFVLDLYEISYGPLVWALSCLKGIWTMGPYFEDCL